MPSPLSVAHQRSRHLAVVVPYATRCGPSGWWWCVRRLKSTPPAHFQRRQAGQSAEAVPSSRGGQSAETVSSPLSVANQCSGYLAVSVPSATWCGSAGWLLPGKDAVCDQLCVGPRHLSPLPSLPEPSSFLGRPAWPASHASYAGLSRGASCQGGNAHYGCAHPQCCDSKAGAKSGLLASWRQFPFAKFPSRQRCSRPQSSACSSSSTCSMALTWSPSPPPSAFRPLDTTLQHLAIAPLGARAHPRLFPAAGPVYDGLFAT